MIEVDLGAVQASLERVFDPEPSGEEQRQHQIGLRAMMLTDIVATSMTERLAMLIVDGRDDALGSPRIEGKVNCCEQLPMASLSFADAVALCMCPAH